MHWRDRRTEGRYLGTVVMIGDGALFAPWEENPPPWGGEGLDENTQSRHLKEAQDCEKIETGNNNRACRNGLCTSFISA